MYEYLTLSLMHLAFVHMDPTLPQCNGYVEGRGNRGLKLILQSNMQTMHIILLKSNI